MACRLRMLRAFRSVGLGCNSMLTSADTAWYWCHLLCRSVSLAGHIPNVYEHLITSYMECTGLQSSAGLGRSYMLTSANTAELWCTPCVGREVWPDVH